MIFLIRLDSSSSYNSSNVFPLETSAPAPENFLNPIGSSAHRCLLVAILEHLVLQNGFVIEPCSSATIFLGPIRM